MRHDVTMRSTAAQRQAGFTLVEMLVVIGILLLIAGITLSAVNLTISGDRVRGSARQVQSYLEGARSRAMYAKSNVGVRFLPELAGWRPGNSYRVGERILPTFAATGFTYKLTAPAGGGTSGSFEPVWPNTVGNTVTDNGLTWTCVSEPVLAGSMIYVEPQPVETAGVVSIGRRDGGPDYSATGNPPNGAADSSNVRFVRGYGTRWRSLYQNGLLSDGARIKIPAGPGGRYYTVLTSELAAYPGYGPEILILSTDFTGTVANFYQLGMGMGYSPDPGADFQPGTIADDDNILPANDPYEWQWPGSDDLTDLLAVNGTFTYELDLTNTPMANQEPRALGNGVVLDLSLSNRLGILIATPHQMDVMFSPRGTVVGPLSATGIVEFVLSDREDSINSIPLTGNSKRERLIVSLTPQTGKTAVHPVYVGTPADPFRYAETGEVAKQ